jgi:hypothetical protein
MGSDGRCDGHGFTHNVGFLRFVRVFGNVREFLGNVSDFTHNAKT